jgi:hypothetical protein
MCGHLCEQAIMNIHAAWLGPAGSDDQASAALLRE